MNKINESSLNGYADVINNYGQYVGATVGTSMRPMIRTGIDTVHLVKIERKLKKYDVVLFRRNSGKYVLHRIIKIKKNGDYVICGDNQWQKEYGITDDNMIGVLAGFYRKEKYIPVDKFGYKLYYHFRVFFRPLRFIPWAIRRVLSKIYRGIFKRHEKKN